MLPVKYAISLTKDVMSLNIAGIITQMMSLSKDLMSLMKYVMSLKTDGVI